MTPPYAAHTLISIFALGTALVGCAAQDGEEDSTGLEGEATSAAVIDPKVPIVPDLNQGSANNLGELSGMAASPDYPGFIWMHRDGLASNPESRERVYAMKIVDRKLVPFTGSSGTYPTRQFTFASSISINNVNWEDIAVGPDLRDNAGTSLYVGDIGNNGGGRNSYQVYQFAQPNPAGTSSVIPALEATWKFAYPTSAKLPSGAYPNCETMFYLDRNLYILTKESEPRVYRFPTGFYTSPATTHTLVQVVNGATTRVVGLVANPSYGSFSSDRQRFVTGAHQRFFVYTLAANTLVGDELVKAMLLTAGRPQAFDHYISNLSTLNAEGGTYMTGTKDVVIGTESKMVFHWPRANAEAP